LPFRKYKKPEETTTRHSILNGLIQEGLVIPEDVQQTLLTSADALDAAVCVLAGKDFLNDKARPPEKPSEREAAIKEGWIWVRKG
jgi:hypothetical protein